jgi:hypothetical protein
LRSELAINPPMLGSSQRLLNRDHFKVYYEGMPRLTNGKGTSPRAPSVVDADCRRRQQHD